jgi:hypothetical protein
MSRRSLSADVPALLLKRRHQVYGGMNLKVRGISPEANHSGDIVVALRLENQNISRFGAEASEDANGFETRGFASFVPPFAGFLDNLRTSDQHAWLVLEKRHVQHIFPPSLFVWSRHI